MMLEKFAVYEGCAWNETPQITSVSLSSFDASSSDKDR